jgi:hypothetical protein
MWECRYKGYFSFVWGVCVWVAGALTIQSWRNMHSYNGIAWAQKVSCVWGDMTVSYITLYTEMALLWKRQGKRERKSFPYVFRVLYVYEHVEQDVKVTHQTTAIVCSRGWDYSGADGLCLTFRGECWAQAQRTKGNLALSLLFFTLAPCGHVLEAFPIPVPFSPHKCSLCPREHSSWAGLPFGGHGHKEVHLDLGRGLKVIATGNSSRLGTWMWFKRRVAESSRHVSLTLKSPCSMVDAWPSNIKVPGWGSCPGLSAVQGSEEGN